MVTVLYMRYMGENEFFMGCNVNHLYTIIPHTTYFKLTPVAIMIYPLVKCFIPCTNSLFYYGSYSL